MTDEERLQQIDRPFYEKQIAPILPPEVLDFHTHAWTRAQWKVVPWETDAAGASYVVTEEDYGLERLEADLQMMFSDRRANAVCFGYPTPAADVRKTNEYIAQAASRPGLFPLMLAGRDLASRETLERGICEQGFFGYKVFLRWQGDDYGSVTIEEMIGPTEMSLANELSLVVLLHVPRSGRLADPVVQKGVRALSHDYPRASIVLAHCGRCYLPDEMKAAVGSVADLENVFMDTSAVMDPTVLQIALETIGPSRLLFGSDLPITAMRGRRVYVMDHWVDVVLEGYPPSAYRVPAANIRATFMLYEIIAAIRRAAEMSGISDVELRAIFYENGMSLLKRVQRRTAP